jgi:large subunit ribosomal protein L25
MNETLTLSVVSVPQGVTLLDDPDETVIATITPPTQEPVEEEIETETELVGEDGEPIEAPEGEGEAEGEGSSEDAGESGDSDES